jgi:hypothetical protein
MAINDLPRGVLERYAAATQTSDLTMPRVGHGVRDADVLLAAGYAARKSPHGFEALMINRMLVTGDYKQLPMVSVVAKRWLIGAMYHRRELPKLNSKHTGEVVTVTLRWWLKGVCPHCDGRGKDLVYPGAQVTSAKDCKPCEGQGRATLDRVAGEHWQAARWLAGRLDRLMDQVEIDMRCALARKEVVTP